MLVGWLALVALTVWLAAAARFLLFSPWANPHVGFPVLALALCAAMLAIWGAPFSIEWSPLP